MSTEGSVYEDDDGYKYLHISITDKNSIEDSESSQVSKLSYLQGTFRAGAIRGRTFEIEKANLCDTLRLSARLTSRCPCAL